MKTLESRDTWEMIIIVLKLMIMTYDYEDTLEKNKSIF